MPRKGENIYKRKDGRWEGRYIKDRTLSGKAIYGYVYAKSYKEVKSKLYHVNKEGKRSDHEQMEIVSLSFGMAALQWLKHIEPQVKESTYIKYRNLVKAYVIPFLGDVRPRDFSNRMLNTYCSALMETGGASKTGLSPKTVSDVVSIIRSIMNYVSHLGCPVMCDEKSISMRQSYKEMRILSTDEQERLQVYIYDNPTLPNLGILICLYTGIRIGELCALSWDDISLSERTLHITKTMQRLQYDEIVKKLTISFTACVCFVFCVVCGIIQNYLAHLFLTCVFLRIFNGQIMDKVIGFYSRSLRIFFACFVQNS